MEELNMKSTISMKESDEFDQPVGFEVDNEIEGK